VTQWRIVLSDGMGSGGVDTLPSDVTVVETTSPMPVTTSLAVVGTASSGSDSGSARVVAGVGLSGVGAAVAIAWWVRALRSV